ncbi:hypothetical protein KAR91_43055 [Candidatus Pacearchaeota archaeon]|nr:hypothetical protein [Candidatus Pacearchaeota archaeon]
MAWTAANPVSIGDATKKSHYDNLWDNADFLYAFVNDCSLTDHGVLLGSGADPITPIAAMTNGQLVVGATGADPAPQTMSGGLTLSSAGVVGGDALIKGWVHFEAIGALSILDDFNVTSVDDDGQGDFTVNWGTNFANDDFAVIGGCNLTGPASIDSLTAATTVIRTRDAAGALTDPAIATVIAIGDQ